MPRTNKPWAPKKSLRQWQEHIREQLAKDAPRIHAIWLQRALPFEDSRRFLEESLRTTTIPNLFEFIADKRYSKIGERHRDLEILCANLLEARERDWPLAISLNRNDYTRREGDRYRRVGHFVVEAVRLLSERGLIDKASGYHRPGRGQGRVTRIWAKEAFMEWFTDSAGRHPPLDFEPVDFVHLKDEKGRLINYKDNETTNQVRSILRRAWLVNRKAYVDWAAHKGRRKVNTTLYAVYIGRWDCYGRLHTGAGGYQSLSEGERATIKIDGVPVVELDFSGMLPRLVYTWENHQLERDPYELRGLPETLRPVLKKLLLIMLNAKDRVDAVASGNKTVLHDSRVLRKAVWAADITIAELVERLEHAHKPIRGHFYTAAWARAFNEDGRIALGVIDHFATKGIPVLAIHDSFLVQASYADELRATMQAAYAKVTGGFWCPIK